MVGTSKVSKRGISYSSYIILPEEINFIWMEMCCCVGTVQFPNEQNGHTYQHAMPLRQRSAPAVEVSVATRDDDLAARLEALA